MSYTVAYTSTFYSVANVKWRVDILTTGTSVTETIDLDYDRPISIEWVDTNKADAIQPALLTVRAINSKDRQFAKLLGDWLAKAEVYRNDRLFWTGMIDDAIFEEPYSYAANYVTEISFSDFGPLKRRDFTLEGVQSIHDIIVHCIDKVGLAGILTSPMISLQAKGVQASLGNMFVNTDVFRGDDEWYPKCYDVLEQALQPFGIRIVQNDNRVLLYDIERLENIGTPVRIVWKGTDAVMSGSECYSQFAVELSPEAKEEVIDGNLDDFLDYWPGEDMYVVQHEYDYDDLIALRYDGFSLSFRTYIPHIENKVVLNMQEGWYFRSHSMVDDADYTGIMRRAYCYRRSSGDFVNVLKTSTPYLTSAMDWLFKCNSMYVPLVSDAGSFQLRVNLDFLFSINRNPIQNKMFMPGNDVDPANWNGIGYFIVPAKLELIDGDGTVLYHYRNMRTLGATERITILPKSQRGWVAGDAPWGSFGLQYYKDGLEENPMEGGFVTNSQSIEDDISYRIGLDTVRTDGEYASMPPAAGYLRLTVSNGIMVKDNILTNPYTGYDPFVCWQMYRNPKVTVVRNNMKDDAIKNEKVVESDWEGDILGKFSTSPKIGTYHKGMAPSSLSLIFDQYGAAYESFTKGGLTDSLEHIRVVDFYGQYISVHISLDGTAELTTSLGPMTDASTSGNFLPMMRNIDPRSDTMQIRMEQIRIEPDPHYYFAWSNPICAKEEELYGYEWSDPVCAKEEGDPNPTEKS